MWIGFFAAPRAGMTLSIQAACGYFSVAGRDEFSRSARLHQRWCNLLAIFGRK
jgi:hypothetical protein